MRRSSRAVSTSNTSEASASSSPDRARAPSGARASTCSAGGSYVDRYLTEEIAAEGIARNVPRFARFLQTAAIVDCREDRPRMKDGIEIRPLEYFLATLWDDGL